MFSGEDALNKAKGSADLAACLTEERLRKDDVKTSVQMADALEKESDPTWKEVKTMKDILGECCSLKCLSN